MEEDKVLGDIAIKVSQLEVLQEANTKAISNMANSVEKLVTKLDQSDDLAREAIQSTKSAHKRLDRIEDGHRWLWRTFAGAFIVAIAAFIISGGLK